MRIQKNIMAINAQRQLMGNNKSVGKGLEKLASGLRVSRAADDAAGLGISEEMRAQIAGLTQAQSNATDGISLVQAAEGALTEVHGILNRMADLATEAANGVYDDHTDRANLQKEVNSLVEEVDRIAQYTKFNGMPLLSGELSGNGVSGSLEGSPVVRFKGAVAGPEAGLDVSASPTNINYYLQDTMEIDGVQVEVDWSRLSGSEKSALQQNWTDSSITGDQAKAAAKVLQNTINQSIRKHNEETGLVVNEITVKADGSPTAFSFISGKADGNSKVSFAGGANTLLGELIGTAPVVSNPPAKSLMSNPIDLNGKFTMRLGGQALEVDLQNVADASDLEEELQKALDKALQNYDTAKGTTGSRDAAEGKIRVELSPKGTLEFRNDTDMSLTFEDAAGGECTRALGLFGRSSAAGGGGLVLQVGSTDEACQKVMINISDMRADALGISSINIGTQGGAGEALTAVNKAINAVSDNRGRLGSVQNRLEHSINNLGQSTENMTAAESRIRDADMAQEMMFFTKDNIVSQAAQSMLAQANQVPQGIMQLLQ